MLYFRVAVYFEYNQTFTVDKYSVAKKKQTIMMMQSKWKNNSLYLKLSLSVDGRNSVPASMSSLSLIRKMVLPSIRIVYVTNVSYTCNLSVRPFSTFAANNANCDNDEQSAEMSVYSSFNVTLIKWPLIVFNCCPIKLHVPEICHI